MSEINPTPEATSPEATSSDPSAAQGKRCARGARRGRWGRRLGVLALLTLGIFALPRAFGWGGGGHCDGHGRGAWTAEQARERMGFMTDRALDEVNATEEQYASIEAILDDAAPRLVEHHAEGRALKARFREQLMQDPADRAALEAIRKEAIALADRASQDALDDLSEAAAVLTPEQRADLAEKVTRRWGGGEPPK